MSLRNRKGRPASSILFVPFYRRSISAPSDSAAKSWFFIGSEPEEKEEEATKTHIFKNSRLQEEEEEQGDSLKEEEEEERNLIRTLPGVLLAEAEEGATEITNIKNRGGEIEYHSYV